MALSFFLTLFSDVTPDGLRESGTNSLAKRDTAKTLILAKGFFQTKKKCVLHCSTSISCDIVLVLMEASVIIYRFVILHRVTGTQCNSMLTTGYNWYCSQIKGSCEQLMDECILVPLFQNESLCETFHIKMSLIIMK